MNIKKIERLTVHLDHTLNKRVTVWCGMALIMVAALAFYSDIATGGLNYKTILVQLMAISYVIQSLYTITRSRRQIEFKDDRVETKLNEKSPIEIIEYSDIETIAIHIHYANITTKDNITHKLNFQNANYLYLKKIKKNLDTIQVNIFRIKQKK